MSKRIILKSGKTVSIGKSQVSSSDRELSEARRPPKKSSRPKRQNNMAELTLEKVEELKTAAEGKFSFDNDKVLASTRGALTDPDDVSDKNELAFSPKVLELEACIPQREAPSPSKEPRLMTPVPPMRVRSSQALPFVSEPVDKRDHKIPIRSSAYMEQAEQNSQVYFMASGSKNMSGRSNIRDDPIQDEDVSDMDHYDNLDDQELDEQLPKSNVGSMVIDLSDIPVDFRNDHFRGIKICMKSLVDNHVIQGFNSASWLSQDSISVSLHPGSYSDGFKAGQESDIRKGTIEEMSVTIGKYRQVFGIMETLFLREPELAKSTLRSLNKWQEEEDPVVIEKSFDGQEIIVRDLLKGVTLDEPSTSEPCSRAESAEVSKKHKDAPVSCAFSGLVDNKPNEMSWAPTTIPAAKPSVSKPTPVYVPMKKKPAPISAPDPIAPALSFIPPVGTAIKIVYPNKVPKVTPLVMKTKVSEKMFTVFSKEGFADTIKWIFKEKCPKKDITKFDLKKTTLTKID